ncbi:T9SS type A sorting domain-containing protein [Mucilaginibacter gotjawali]|uniref:Secretion system C-terminal sorting domain-containing protein n=1 Tax=Mucilaginibacter gotjawali TaxID=1550579 RepID=A0A839SA67_9SPHI|nr:T9SS type A sorting domain-containing protein [Mucilaginibacter gotjawali]MBB3054726.1 hypothetical protein [Mucilaginibacter gotjawali]
MAHRILVSLFFVSICLSTLASGSPVKRNDSTPIPLLRLKLVMDAFNNDDIAIGFDAAATTVYNNQLDSRYMEGINAPEGLSSLSSDDIQLSVNIVPLPRQGPLVIRLDVEAAKSGAFTLERTELDSIPAIYDVWLIDQFAKDSLDLRTGNRYAFNIDKNNSTSFGNNRFRVIIRQNPALGIHLLSFDAIKATKTAQLTWKTENEETTTVFAAERSIDEGATFYMLDTLRSNGAGSYSYTDKTPLDGNDLYRIKITDMNGTVSYSNAITIGFGSTLAEPGASDNISIFPNPSNGIINLSIAPKSTTGAAGSAQKQTSSTAKQNLAAILPAGSASYDIKIFNINGSVLKESTSAAASWQTNVSTLLPGTYIIQVTNNSDNTLVGKSTFIKL